MFLPAHLRRSRHGVYYFRIVLPDGLRAVFGKREFIRSLGTKCPRQARLAAGLLSSTLAVKRSEGAAAFARAIQDMRPKDVVELKFGAIRLKDGTELIDVSTTSDDPVMLKAEMEELSVLIRRHGGRIELEPTESTQASAPAPQAPVVVTPARPKSLGDAWSGFMSSRRSASVSTKQGYTESFELFAELLGGKQRLIHELTDAEILEYVDALGHVPAHAKKRKILIGTIAGLKRHLPQYITSDGEIVDAEVISDNTADQHVVRIRGFLAWAIKAQHRTGANPLDGGVGFSAKGSNNRALPFLDHELSKILDPASLMQSVRPTQYWTILLCLYTGARLNELACLDLTDVVVEGGVRCFSIRHDPDVPSGEAAVGGRSPKRTKNAASIRLVPVHPDLIDLGLDDYIEDLQALGATRFFPNAPLDEKGKRERRLSHDGNEYLKKVGVHQHRTKILHSFRSVVINKLRNGGMSENRRHQWTGHTDDSVQGTHYLVPEDMTTFSQDGFRALVFPQVDKQRLRYFKGWWTDYLRANMKD